MGRARLRRRQITTDGHAATRSTEKDGKGFYVFESVSTNQDGAEVVRGDLDQHRPRSLSVARAMAESRAWATRSPSCASRPTTG